MPECARKTPKGPAEVPGPHCSPHYTDVLLSTTTTTYHYYRRPAQTILFFACISRFDYFHETSDCFDFHRSSLTLACSPFVFRRHHRTTFPHPTTSEHWAKWAVPRPAAHGQPVKAARVSDSSTLCNLDYITTRSPLRRARCRYRYE